MIDHACTVESTTVEAYSSGPQCTQLRVLSNQYVPVWENDLNVVITVMKS